MEESLFERLKSSMPTNQVLCKSVIARKLQGRNSEFIKQNFSKILDEIHEEIYDEYKSKEKALILAATTLLNNIVKRGYY